MNKPIRITPRIRVKSEFFLNSWMIENRTSQGAEKLQAPEANPNGEFVSGKACGETGIVLHARAGPGLSAKNLSVSKRLHTSTPLAVYSSSSSGSGKAASSQAMRAGLIVVVFMDSSASVPMKYLDDFVDSLGVTNNFMTAADNAFRSGAIEVTAPIRDDSI